MICFSRQTHKEQAEQKAAEAVQAKATQAAKEAEEAAKATQAAKEAEEAAKAAQVAKASQAPKAALGKPVTPTTPDILINPSPSPGSDDFEENIPRRTLNPHSLNYSSSGRSTPLGGQEEDPTENPCPHLKLTNQLTAQRKSYSGGRRNLMQSLVSTKNSCPTMLKVTVSLRMPGSKKEM